MSYTELFKFNKQGYAEHLGEVKNAWRGAMAVWKIIEEKHLPSLPEPAWSLGEKKEYWSRTTMMFSLSDDRISPMKEIWGLFSSDKLTLDEKIVLGSTFDNVVILKDNLKKTIQAFKNFEGETSLKEQAKILEKVLDDENVISIGFNQTSIIADTWLNCGDFDEKIGKHLPYNVLTGGDKHWKLFAELSNSKNN